MKKTKTVTRTPEAVFQLWGWILLAWSLYRYFFKFPEWADELVFKPLVFAAPVIWYVLTKEKKHLSTLGITLINLRENLFLGIGFGVVFIAEGIISNSIKTGSLSLLPQADFGGSGILAMVVLSLATSITEEILSRGFLFSRIYEHTQKLVYSAFAASFMFVLLHIPILVTSLKLQGPTLVLYFITNFMLGIINCVVYARTKSLAAPVLIHLFWNLTVALYL